MNPSYCTRELLKLHQDQRFCKLLLIVMQIKNSTDMGERNKINSKEEVNISSDTTNNEINQE